MFIVICMSLFAKSTTPDAAIVPGVPFGRSKVIAKRALPASAALVGASASTAVDPFDDGDDFAVPAEPLPQAASAATRTPATISGRRMDPSGGAFTTRVYRPAAGAP